MASVHARYSDRHVMVAAMFRRLRIPRRQVDESWHGQITHGLAAIRDPVFTEALTIARGRN
jgi:hypothetical protein